MVWYIRALFPLEVHRYEVYVPPTNMFMLNVNILVSRECCALKFIIYIPQTPSDDFMSNLMFCDASHFIANLTQLWTLIVIQPYLKLYVIIFSEELDLWVISMMALITNLFVSDAVTLRMLIYMYYIRMKWNVLHMVCTRMAGGLHTFVPSITKQYITSLLKFSWLYHEWLIPRAYTPHTNQQHNLYSVGGLLANQKPWVDILVNLHQFDNGNHFLLQSPEARHNQTYSSICLNHITLSCI